MRWMLGKSWALMVISLLGIGSIAHADSAVIVGAGHVGAWFTTGYVANPSSSTENLSIASAPFPCQPPMACPIQAPVAVPPLGSVSLEDYLSGEFETFYVTQQEAQPPAFPLVRASLRNYVDVGGPYPYPRSVDIPVVLVSQLVAANLSTLSFGNVQEGPAILCAQGATCFFGHSSLVLGNIQRTDGNLGEDLPVTLELFDYDGSSLGSGSLTITRGQTALIADVVQYLGAAAPTLGLLRVTRKSGGALMWGILYTTDDTGAVTATAGANLSP